jgi:hypothetical protein
MIFGDSLKGGRVSMKSSKLTFVSAIAMIAAVATVPAQASTPCTSPYSQANGPQVINICGVGGAAVIISAQTWSNFFGRGTGATMAKGAEFPIPAFKLTVGSFVLCANGTIRSSVGTSTHGDEVDQLVGCDPGILAVLGQGQALMATP